MLAHSMTTIALGHFLFSFIFCKKCRAGSLCVLCFSAAVLPLFFQKEEVEKEQPVAEADNSCSSDSPPAKKAALQGS